MISVGGNLLPLVQQSPTPPAADSVSTSVVLGIIVRSSSDITVDVVVNALGATTLAAMINHINENQYGHILTVEDPIEFVHKSQQSLINHREVGVHTRSFASALRTGPRMMPAPSSAACRAI